MLFSYRLVFGQQRVRAEIGEYGFVRFCNSLQRVLVTMNEAARSNEFP